MFTENRELQRALLTLDYYRFVRPAMRLSHFLNLELQQREQLSERLHKKDERRVDIIAYCLMPNHFHFLLKQNRAGGVSRFLADFTNSYTRYFNTRNKGRKGPIFQGVFRAVRIEDDEQLIHISRYIHLNPVVSYIVEWKDMLAYPWSSLPEYAGVEKTRICGTEIVLGHFSSSKRYLDFLSDQVDYGRELERIKHVLLED